MTSDDGAANDFASPDSGGFKAGASGTFTSSAGELLGCGSTGATCMTIFNCFGSIVGWPGWRLPPDLAREVPGERPLGVGDDSGSLKRFSAGADGFWSFIVF